MDGNQHYRNGQKIIFDICVTSFFENVDGQERFLSAIAYIVEVFEVIVYKSGSRNKVSTIATVNIWSFVIGIYLAHFIIGLIWETKICQVIVVIC